MKKAAIFLIVLFISAAAFAFSPAPTAEKAGDLPLKDLSGKTVSLNSYKGKVILLVIFQTTCPSCRHEMSEVESLYLKYRSKDFDVLAVSVAEDANVVRLFARENKLTFTFLLDKEGGIARAYNVRFIPRTLILDRSGNVEFNSHYIPAEDLEKGIKKAIK
jgi:peroxiredoxin